MKFISEIKKEKAITNVNIKIPIYHRTSISFFNDSEVYYIYRTYKSNNKSDTHELILSPLKPNIWHHIRKVTLSVEDSPGVINAITSKLRDLKINVNIEEALTTQIGAVHTVTLIIDIGLYLKENNHNVADKVPQSAIEAIESELKRLPNPYNRSKPIVFKDQIYIKELTFLENISPPEDSKKSCISPSQFANCSNQKIKNNKGNITLDAQLIRRLGLKSDSFFYYAMFSDTEDKYINLLIFGSNQKVAFINIFHEDEYGAIASFTQVIKNSKFNILATYSHQQMQKEKAHWFALIDISNDPEKFFTKTLDLLRKCKYGPGPENEQKTVLDVFLIEANTDDIPDDIILRFGQNKLTKDYVITSVYKKKRKLIEGLLNNNVVSDDPNSLDKFVENHRLHTTSSLKRLVKRIIAQKKAKRANMIKRVFRLGGATILTVLFIGLLTFLPQTAYIVEGLKKHASELIFVTIIVVIFVLSLLFSEKAIEILSEKLRK